ncbi:hypothetical protein D9M70_469550 [compost metagenome]
MVLEIRQRIIVLAVPEQTAFADVRGNRPITEQRILKSGPGLPVKLLVLVVAVRTSEFVDQEHIDVILQVLTNPFQVMHDRHTNGTQVVRRAYA